MITCQRYLSSYSMFYTSMRKMCYEPFFCDMKGYLENEYNENVWQRENPWKLT